MSSPFLEWFFQPTECLLVRQFYSMLEVLVSKGSWSEEWKDERRVFSCLVDIWDDHEPDSGDNRHLSDFLLAAFYDKLSSGQPAAPISDESFHELISSAIWFALKDANPNVKDTVVSLNRWSRRGATFSASPYSPPQIDRLLYGLGMFGSESGLGGFDSDLKSRLMSFVKALPFAALTRHLPLLAELSIALRNKFGLQLNLLYLLLRACENRPSRPWDDRETPPLAGDDNPADSNDNPEDVLWFVKQCDLPIDLSKLRDLLKSITALCPDRTTGYGRLNAFVWRVVEIHNSLILPSDFESVPFRYVQANFLLPYARLDNTILPALVHKWSDVSAVPNWELFVETISFLSEKWDDSANPDIDPVVFFEDFELNVRFRRISLDPGLDFLGFAEKDFLRSLPALLEYPPAPAKGLRGCRRFLLDTSFPLIGVNSDQFDQYAPLWALVWLLFFEEGDEEKEPKIVKTYNELVTMFGPLTRLDGDLVADRLRHYREFDPGKLKPALYLGTATARLPRATCSGNSTPTLEIEC
jgi:hypothetical protein